MTFFYTSPQAKQQFPDPKPSLSTLTRWASHGIARKIGGRWRYYPEAINALVAGVPLDKAVEKIGADRGRVP